MLAASGGSLPLDDVFVLAGSTEEPLDDALVEDVSSGVLAAMDEFSATELCTAIRSTGIPLTPVLAVDCGADALVFEDASMSAGASVLDDALLLVVTEITKCSI